MDGFTLVDGVVLAIIALSAILAYSRGLVRETLAILGWVAAAIAGFVLAPVAEPLIREVPGLSNLIGTNCELGILAGFVAVFAIALVLVSLFTPLLSGAVQNSALGPVDQGLGFLFGVARGILLVLIALVVYDKVLAGSGSVPMVDNSRTVEIFSGVQEQLATVLPEDAPQWIAGQYEKLTSSCSDKSDV
jgi:membrane protein required for colicin V production